MASFVSHLECSQTGEIHSAREVHGRSRAGAPLIVRYDLAALKGAVSKEALAKRSEGFWRYREFLPVEMEKNRISLGEAPTPLVRAPRIEALRGGGELSIKDEGRLPSGSSSARSVALALSMAKELRLRHVAIGADGADGAALAAYAARAGLRATVFCPDGTPSAILGEIALAAEVFRVNGSVDDCARIVREGREQAGWFDVTPLAEPYGVEGAKTLGLEIAEQFGWSLPDWIFHHAGSGAAVAGLSKAFDELEAIGWIGSKRPKIVAARQTGAASRGAQPDPVDARGRAAGIVDVNDDDAGIAFNEMAREEGLLLSPGGAAAYAAYRRTVAERRIGRGERALVINGETGLRRPLPAAGAFIDRAQPIDYARFRSKPSGDE